MKVVILSETYAEAMGYAGTCIPAAMAKIPGVEVHYVTAGFFELVKLIAVSME